MTLTMSAKHSKVEFYKKKLRLDTFEFLALVDRRHHEYAFKLQRKLLAERNQIKYEKHWKFCSEGLEGIIDFAMRVAEYR